MSSFAVQVRTIDDVRIHPNADRLSVARVGGYECVIGRDQYVVGDVIVYVPEGAVVPEPILRKHNFWKEGDEITIVDGVETTTFVSKGMLAGPKGDRVHPLRLRGIYSQGIVLPVLSGEDPPGDDEYAGTPWLAVEVPDAADTNFWEMVGVDIGDDVANIFGITKYEPEIPAELQGSVFNSHGVSYRFDFDSIQSSTDLFSEGEDVIGTEKIHGFNTQIGYIPGLNHDDCFGALGNIYITSKLMGAKGMSFMRVNSEGEFNDNVYTRSLQALLDSGFEEAVKRIAAGAPIRLFAEIYGAQDLKYGRNKKDVGIALFGVYRGDFPNGRWVPYDERLEIAETLQMQHVPLLYRGPFDAERLRAVRDGKDTWTGKHIREGVVIEHADPNVEHPHLGRKIAKWVSPDYGGRKGGTEFQ